MVLPRPPTQRPTVSVVVPCYNYGHYLPDAVGSAVHQVGVQPDVIIVDDCSTDGSELVAQELVRRYDSVRLIRNEANQKHIATYNIGLAEATGDYVVLLSADDMLAPGSLRRATALMEAFPDVGLVYGFSPAFTQAPTRAPVPRTWSLWSGDEWLKRMASRGDNLIMNPEAVMRGSLMRELVGYDPAFPHAADMLLWMNAARRANVGRVNGVQAYYRMHESNMHLTSFAGILTDMVERSALYSHFFDESGPGAEMENARELLAAAQRSLASEAMWCAALAADAGGTVGGGSAREFAEFALATYPRIDQHWLWAEYRRHDRPAAPRWRAQALVTAHDLLWRAKWRKWRRFGT